MYSLSFIIPYTGHLAIISNPNAKTSGCFCNESRTVTGQPVSSRLKLRTQRNQLCFLPTASLRQIKHEILPAMASRTPTNSHSNFTTRLHEGKVQQVVWFNSVRKQEYSNFMPVHNTSIIHV